MMKEYELIAMDLDGTLTQHKSKLDGKNTALLQSLQKKYCCLMVGAGSCLRIYEQMNAFPIDIIGNYGMQLSTVQNGEFRMVKDDIYVVDREKFECAITALRKQTGYESFVGDNVEFHASGAVTFPLLGTKAELSAKLAFDPKGEKRSRMLSLVESAFPEYNCFIGGTSSFDIVQKRYDKFHALKEYALARGICSDKILFVGDDFKKGGNDESVMLGGIDCIVITDYTNTTEVLKDKGIL